MIQDFHHHYILILPQFSTSLRDLARICTLTNSSKFRQMSPILSFYQAKLSECQTLSTRLVRQSRFYAYGKLVTFVLALACGYVAFHFTSISLMIICIILIGIYIYLLITDYQCLARLDRLHRCEQVCTKEIAAFNHDFSLFQDGSAFTDYKHSYTTDLDIFGPGSLYQRLNRTVTPKGSERLAWRLSHLESSPQKICHYAEAIAELSKDPDWRIRFEGQPYIQSHPEFLEQMASLPDMSLTSFQKIWPYVSVSITLLAFLGAIVGLLPWFVFSICGLLQFMLTVSRQKKSIQESLRAEKLHQEYRGYLQLLYIISEAPHTCDKLQNIHRTLFESEANCLSSFRKLSLILNLNDQRSNGLMYILLNSLFLYDIMLTRKFTQWCKTYLPYAHDWLEALAEMDMLVSLSAYAFNHPENHYAEFLPDDATSVIKAQGLYHPFLTPEKAVPNHFELRKDQTVLITGANMAGKSTFLRAVGTNYIMATMGLPVCAQAFQCTVMSLFSSMRTTDNLTSDTSYFHAELLRLKALIIHAQTHTYTLAILDEILKGTNSRDKLKGSVLFLKELSRYPVSAIVATHDLELARLEEEEPSHYTNYCFEIDLSNEIHYSYQIRKGVAQNLNASYLLTRILDETRQTSPEKTPDPLKTDADIPRHDQSTVTEKNDDGPSSDLLTL